MSLARAVVRSQKGEATLARPAFVTLAVLALATVMQVHFGAFGDVSWLITVCEGWLDGKVPYVDFFETNPPPAILLYMPPVIAARLMHLRPEMVVAAYGLAIAWGSATLASAILKRAALLPRPAPLFDALALIALVLLPGRTFDERDFFALCFGLPYIALSAARAERSPVALIYALVAGAGLGLMVALKAPYVAIPALLALRLPLSVDASGAGKRRRACGRRRSDGDQLHLPFPAYFADVAPIVATAYLPVRESLATLVANAALVAALTLGGVAVAASPRARPDNLTLTFLIAAAGAIVAYFVQGKGWLYHVYPALALACLAFAATLERRERDGLALAVAGALAAFTFAGAALFDLAPLPTALVGAICARLLMMRFAPDGGRERLTTIAGGALVGAACGLYALSFPGPSPAFTRALLDAAPHPRIATIGEGLGIGFPRRAMSEANGRCACRAC